MRTRSDQRGTSAGIQPQVHEPAVDICQSFELRELSPPPDDVERATTDEQFGRYAKLQSLLLALGVSHRKDLLAEACGPNAPMSLDDVLGVLRALRDKSSQTASTGFLYKRGRLVKSWRRRFFVVDGDRLKYFEDETRARPLGHIELREVVDISELDSIAMAGLRPVTDFALRVSTIGRVLYLCASSSAERSAWSARIAAAVANTRSPATARKAPHPCVDVEHRDLELVRVLGAGAAGTVWEAEWNMMPGKRVAFKTLRGYDEVVPLDELRAEEAELKSEVGLLSRLRHGNILTLYAATALPP